MDRETFFRNLVHGTRILRPPKHNLATFGTTTLRYVLLSEMPEGESGCRLREGKVTAERPQILTPDLWKKRFEGFGEDSEAYRGFMENVYGDAFKALEYTFKNELERTSLQTSPLREVAERAMQSMDLENLPRTALLQGPDATWALSIMKFIVEVSMRSFPGNVKELDERGFFNPQKRAEDQQRHRIERLFREAQQNPDSVSKLAEVLKETGLFGEYEDRFFALVGKP